MTRIAAADESPETTARPPTSTSMLGQLPYWDDGLSEVSYYKAVDVIYGKPRSYVRVHMVNRQWMNPTTGVKSSKPDAESLPVLKLNISEEIPTENYNYRYLTTIFARRSDLAPFKMTLSSQEWCGTTFKHLRWTARSLEFKSYSYFAGEGDNVWSLPSNAVALESLFLIARDVAAVGKPRQLSVLNSPRSNHHVMPVVSDATLEPRHPETVSTTLGMTRAIRVDMRWDGVPTSFLVEQKAPFRLLRYRVGAMQGELQGVERRAYWDRDKPSDYYEPNNAP